MIYHSDTIGWYTYTHTHTHIESSYYTNWFSQLLLATGRHVSHKRISRILRLWQKVRALCEHRETHARAPAYDIMQKGRGIKQNDVSTITYSSRH